MILVCLSMGCSRGDQIAASPSLAANTPTAPQAYDDDDGHGHADETLEYDFGLLKPGVQASHVFKVHNPTAATWTLVKVTRTCSCSVASASSPTIKPGETEQFTLRL